MIDSLRQITKKTISNDLGIFRTISLPKAPHNSCYMLILDDQNFLVGPLENYQEGT